jgi:hypothetical protein
MCWEQQSALMLHRTTQLYSADGVAQRGVLTHRLMSTAVAADCIRRDTERGGLITPRAAMSLKAAGRCPAKTSRFGLPVTKLVQTRPNEHDSRNDKPEFSR